MTINVVIKRYTDHIIYIICTEIFYNELFIVIVLYVLAFIMNAPVRLPFSWSLYKQIKERCPRLKKPALR